jgi:hypothetical protein
VKAHSGILLNECAERLAALGIFNREKQELVVGLWSAWLRFKVFPNIASSAASS